MPHELENILGAPAPLYMTKNMPVFKLEGIVSPAESFDAEQVTPEDRPTSKKAILASDDTPVGILMDTNDGDLT